MASLIPDYEYDIFISYRQKDNKYDGWVTEFVNNLKKELEATFKDDISLFFDINPHDGLMETHDVNASLEEKLKCLVFIPIISQTYCDPKSFAWEHEFKAFVKFASQDQFGLKVRLPGGNIASRVLPVRIYDLNNEDVKLCESILGGTLRGIEFIYKSAGVNRPLRANEDHAQDNLNKTYYRDQIIEIQTKEGFYKCTSVFFGKLKTVTGIKDGQCFIEVDANSDPGGTQLKKLGLNCDLIPFLKELHYCIFGLLMELKTSGLDLDDKVNVTKFLGDDCLALTFTCDTNKVKNIYFKGTDWTVFIDPLNYSMKGYRTNGKMSSYNVISGNVEVNGIKIPLCRTLFNSDNSIFSISMVSIPE